MKNLLSMDEVSKEEIMLILKRAAEFESGAKPQLEKEYFIANLFLSQVQEQKHHLNQLKEK